MNYQEAIKTHINECRHRIDVINDFMESNEDADKDECNKNIEVLKTAISAMQELQMYKDSKLVLIPDSVHKKQCEELDKYKQIGTLEEFKKLKECEFSGIQLAEIACSINLLKDYQKLGTLEEVREAVEKQVAKKPENVGTEGYRYTDTYRCPTCGGNFSGTGMANYCYHCGQSILWEDEEE